LFKRKGTTKKRITPAVDSLASGRHPLTYNDASFNTRVAGQPALRVACVPRASLRDLFFGTFAPQTGSLPGSARPAATPKAARALPRSATIKKQT